MDVNTIKREIEKLKRVVTDLQDLKRNFPKESSSKFNFYGNVKGNIIGRVVYRGKAYNSVKEIDDELKGIEKMIDSMIEALRR